MKKLYFIISLLLILPTTSCQDVVDVDLETIAPKLVIEAGINWQKGSVGNVQTIKLSTTTSYFSTTFPPVLGATVQVKNSNNVVFNFAQTGLNGEYICNNFVPQIGETYTLTIIHSGQTYEATDVLTAVAPITNINQKNDAGFGGDEIEIKANYIDPGNQANFYLFKHQFQNRPRPEYYVDDDEFYNGNPFFSLASSDKIKKDDQVEITHFGVSRTYFNYLAILLDIAGSNGGAPFQSPPATVRGNIINKTNFNDFPLGFFSLSEIDKKTYTIQ